MLYKNPLLPKRNRCTIWKNSPPKFAIFALRNIRTAIVLFQMRKRISAKLSLRTRTSTHVLQNCFEVEARVVNMQNIKNNHGQKKGLKMFIKLEYPQVCKVPQQRLKKCLESKWDVIVNKLKKPRNLCKRTSMTDPSLLSIPGTLIALKGVIMLKGTSCNEEKLRRQQIKKREK